MKKFFIISAFMLHISIICFSQDNNDFSSRKDSICEYAKEYAIITNNNVLNPNISKPYLLTGVLTVMLSPIPGYICASYYTNEKLINDILVTYPPELNLTISDPLLNVYNECYKYQAFKIRKKFVWTGFAIGTGIFSIIWVPLLIKEF